MYLGKYYIINIGFISKTLKLSDQEILINIVVHKMNKRIYDGVFQK